MPNFGLKKKNEDIGAGIKERETRLVRDDDSKDRFVRDAITYRALDSGPGVLHCDLVNLARETLIALHELDDYW